MKNLLFLLFLMANIGEMSGQKNRFHAADYRDCVHFGAQWYKPNEVNEYGDALLQLLYSHDFLKKNNFILRSRSGIDCFIDWGFHLQSGLLVATRADFLEFSAGPVLHAGSVFKDYNNASIGFGFGFGPPPSNSYFKLGFNATASATIFKILVLSWEWQVFKTTGMLFTPTGTPAGSKRIWVKSFGPQIGFRF